MKLDDDMENDETCWVCNRGYYDDYDTTHRGCVTKFDPTDKHEIQSWHENCPEYVPFFGTQCTILGRWATTVHVRLCNGAHINIGRDETRGLYDPTNPT